jgi:hypothetical protein
MRSLVIQRLTTIIEDCEGIPRFFESDDYITDAEELESMSDEELLEAFETAVGFAG